MELEFSSVSLGPWGATGDRLLQAYGRHGGRGALGVLTEDVFEEKGEPGWRFLFWEDLSYQCKDIGDRVQVEHLCELLDVLRVAGARGERFHGQEVFWGSREYAQAWVVEDTGWRWVSARCHIGACLLVQPPVRQAKFSGYSSCFFKHDAVRLEQGVNVASSTARIVSQGHRSTAEHVDVRHHPPLGQPITETPESLFDALAIEQGRRFTHAASIS
jgi:hypothetical protein